MKDFDMSEKRLENAPRKLVTNQRQVMGAHHKHSNDREDSIGNSRHQRHIRNKCSKKLWKVGRSKNHCSHYNNDGNQRDTCQVLHDKKVPMNEESQLQEENPFT